MHAHRALLTHATDTWEISAGLEAQGLTDADARRLRHRDIFGLAEELFARAPRARQPAPPPTSPPYGGTAGPWLKPPTAVAHLLPAAACAAATAAPYHRLLAPLLLALATAALTRRGPLRAATGPGAVWAAALLALTLPRLSRVDLVGLAAALLPAALAAHWFAVRARAQLAPSHGLSDFADAVRPRLAAAFAAYTVVLLAAVRASPLPLALGMLLLTARLLAVHRRPAPAAAGLAAAAVAAALSALAGCLGLPGDGPAGPAAACAAAALALAVQAFRLLPRASAHHST